MSYQHNPSEVESPANPNCRTEQELAYIGGMLDGIIRSFEFRGLTVERRRNSIIVRNDEGEQLGGAHYCEADALDIHDWLWQKVLLWGGEGE